MGDGAQGWGEGFLKGEVSQDAGALRRLAMGASRHSENGLPVQCSKEDEGDGAWGSGAGVSVLYHEGMKTGT